MKTNLFKSIAGAATLGVALTGSATAASYFQDFTFADGTTALGDGSTLGSSVNNVAGNIASVQGNALRLTENVTGGQRASFRIPALPNSSLGWTATFGLTLEDAVGGNPPADGFTFNYGAILGLATTGPGADGHGAAEAGQGSGNEISAAVDTWNNNDPSAGLGILVNGAQLGASRIDGIVVPTDGSVTGTVSITWTPTEFSFVTTGLNTNANFVNVPHTFAGDDSHSWVFSARTGGATENLIIDNLNITTVPEPSGLALLGLGLSSLILRRRR